MMNLRNYMEVCIEEKLNEVLPNIECCDCEKCKMDITAIALNSLPPKYVVTQKGELYTRLYAFQQQMEADLAAAITKAAVIVAENPRHFE
ncbi:MAG: late competence development ComFB family protein [Clostridiales bacterium]|nr:late competence development ComFB family protein [Clostridiales bacterium]